MGAEDLKLRGLSENDKINNDKWSWSSPETMGIKSGEREKKENKNKSQMKEDMEEKNYDKVKETEKLGGLVLKEETKEEEEGQVIKDITEVAASGSETEDTSDLLARISQ